MNLEKLVLPFDCEDGMHHQTPALYPEEFEQRLVRFFRETLEQ